MKPFWFCESNKNFAVKQQSKVRNNVAYFQIELPGISIHNF